MRLGLSRLALSSGAAMAPTLAFAQTIGAGTSIIIDPQLDRDDVAGARIEPAYRPRPILVGPIFAQPSLSIVGGYDSNVFNRSEAKAAALATIMPSLVLDTQLPRHELKLSAAGTLRRFSRYRTENSGEYAVNADGRLDLGARQAVRISVDFAHLIEPRSSFGSVADAAEPVGYDQLSASLGATVKAGAFRLTPSLRYERLDYTSVALSAGGKADQSFRDTRSERGGVRIDYDLSGLVSAFAEGDYEHVGSPSAQPVQQRNSRNYIAMVGLRGQLSPVISGEVGIGYQARDYAQPAYRDFAGVTYRADVQWYVTPLMTLRAQASRTFRNSGNRQVGGILTDTVTLSAYYDPLRNLRFALSASLEHGDFGDVDTRTLRKALRLRAQYRLSPSFSVGGYLGFLRQDVRGVPLVNAFTSFSAGIGFTITP